MHSKTIQGAKKTPRVSFITFQRLFKPPSQQAFLCAQVFAQSQNDNSQFSIVFTVKVWVLVRQELSMGRVAKDHQLPI